MKSFVLFFISFSLFAANRPYTDVVEELVANSCTKKRENIFLTQEDRKKIEKASESNIYGGLALRYVVTCEDGSKEYHYVDSHIVRTLNETVIVSVKNNTVSSYIVSSFSEPPEYKAPDKWYQQFIGHAPGKLLKAQKNIDGLSGATLTVNSSVDAVNRIMAMHQLLQKKMNTKEEK